MSWGFVGTAAVTAVSSYFSGNSAARAQNKMVIEQNKAIVKANLSNTVRTGYRVGILNMQMAQQRQQFAKAGHDLSVQGLEALGSNAANAAAAGVIGSSVEAVEGDIRMKLGEAKIGIGKAWESQTINFNTELRSIVDQGKDSLQGANGTVAAGKTWGQAIGDGLLAAGSRWLQGYMTLGLGTPTATSTGMAQAPVSGALGSGMYNLNSPVTGGSLNLGFSTGTGLKWR